MPKKKRHKAWEIQSVQVPKSVGLAKARAWVKSRLGLKIGKVDAKSPNVYRFRQFSPAEIGSQGCGTKVIRSKSMRANVNLVLCQRVPVKKTVVKRRTTTKKRVR